MAQRRSRRLYMQPDSVKVPLKPRQLHKLMAARAESTAEGVDSITSNVQALDVNRDSTPRAISVCFGQGDPLAFYVRSLLQESQWFPLTLDNTYALADCDAKGCIKRRSRFQLVQAKAFESPSGETHVVYLCSCEAAQEQQVRLSSTANAITGEDLQDFAVREEGLYCLHARAAKQIITTSARVEEEDEGSDDENVDQLQTSPFLAAAHDGETYGILKRIGEGGRLCCMMCSSRQMSCSHVETYKEWCRDRGVDESVVFTAADEPTFESVSKSSIPYPWTKDMREKFDRYDEKLEIFPQHLVPDVPSGTCSHGNDWDHRDPVSQKWVQHTGVTIYTRYTTIVGHPGPDGQRQPRVVYYRPTVGNCRCRHLYDGTADLLHNLDNRTMLFFGLLVDYLHSMVQGYQPLRTTQRECNQTRSTCSFTKSIPWEKLRQGWNSWARRLNIDWNEVYTCRSCGTEPKTIICDGTAIGFRKDFLHYQAAPEDQPEMPVVCGSKHCHRVFVNCAKSRELLLRYSAEKRSRTGKELRKCTLGISDEEMTDLQCKLAQANRGDLVALLKRLHQEGHTTRAPPEYSTFLSEVARSTPVCGMVQIAGDRDAIDIMRKVAEGKIDLTNSRFFKYCGYVQKKAPVLTDFLCSVTKAGHIPPDISTLVLSLMTVLTQTFKEVEKPSPDCYPAPPAPSYLSFFPTLRQLCGLPRYAVEEASKPRAKDSCRKESYGHPSLTPGLFTVFCPHGVCYGFEAMRSCESPRHPFEILRTRFKVAPRVVVYDNACQLHRYVMNREPHFFQKTVFLVDRLHFKGHVGCSLGYSMNSYAAAVDISTLNSQVNEQANAGLIRIQPQLAYMRPANFMFHTSLFLAVKNMLVRGIGQEDD
ncbi:Hypp1182 [Branchiostoma lanceolatum]|uniref:Hypp1182 protein n=1 Tax=Branchiostoma lanceolatum TaxID=7740 RepID=A0A8K0EMA3_BRALA|nr:Hypp1182 [Branchiostoma lanceolatum]